ncbi:MAG: hypothetical protein MJ072_03825, partial [Clostridia bacterium]|nr:hypothetical protein [Clostridia bacterium]
EYADTIIERIEQRIKEIEERSRILFPNMQKQNDENRKEDLHSDSEHDTLFLFFYHQNLLLQTRSEIKG